MNEKAHPTISDHARALQRLAAQARWSGLTAAQRSTIMRRVRRGKKKS
jgi:hypothetical protein